MFISMRILLRMMVIGILAIGVTGLGKADLANAGEGKPGHHHDAKKHDHGKMDHHNMPGGMPGEAANVSRKILVVAKDTEFNIKSIQVKDGETIKFIVKNKGKLVHEFTIGDVEMQKMHQKEMMKMADDGKLMADKVAKDAVHTHPNSVILEPGETKEIIWMFHKGAEIEFGCNIPGHYDQGMKGKFLIGS